MLVRLCFLKSTSHLLIYLVLFKCNEYKARYSETDQVRIFFLIQVSRSRVGQLQFFKSIRAKAMIIRSMNDDIFRPIFNELGTKAIYNLKQAVKIRDM